MTLARVETPDPEGQVSFGPCRGDRALDRAAQCRHVFALSPNMSGVDNVAYGLRIRGIPRAERRHSAGEIEPGADVGLTINPGAVILV